MKQEKIDFPESGLLGKLLWQENNLWQMRLQKPNDLARFSRERGIGFQTNQDIIKLWQLRLLHADLVISPRKLYWKGMTIVGTHDDGRYVYANERGLRGRSRGWTDALASLPYFPSDTDLLFRPFRLYVLLRLESRINGMNVNPMQMFAGDKYPGLIEYLVSIFQKSSSSPRFVKDIDSWNDIVSLAILAEPFSYQKIFGVSSIDVDDPNIYDSMEKYEEALSLTYKNVGLDIIEAFRHRLCADAELLDRNRNVHSILRLSSGEFRLKITRLISE